MHIDRRREIGVKGSTRAFASGLLTFFSLEPLFGLLIEAHKAVHLGRRRRIFRLRERGRIGLRGRKETLFGLFSEEFLVEELDLSFELLDLLSKERNGLLGGSFVAKGSMGAGKTGRRQRQGSSVRRRRLRGARVSDGGREQKSTHAPVVAHPNSSVQHPPPVFMGRGPGPQGLNECLPLILWGTSDILGPSEKQKQPHARIEKTHRKRDSCIEPIRYRRVCPEPRRRGRSSPKDGS